MAEQELAGQKLEEHVHAQNALYDLENCVDKEWECYETIITKYYGTYSSVSDLVCDLSGCKCCERHQTNRPNKFEQYFDPPILPGVVPVQKPEHELNCLCKCRLIIRTICRYHDTFVENINRGNEIQEDDKESDEEKRG
jgi:hypothetical protein